MHFGCILFLISVVTTVLVSLITEPIDEKYVLKCFNCINYLLKRSIIITLYSYIASHIGHVTALRSDRYLKMKSKIIQQRTQSTAFLWLVQETIFRRAALVAKKQVWMNKQRFSTYRITSYNARSHAWSRASNPWSRFTWLEKGGQLPMWLRDSKGYSKHRCCVKTDYWS